MEKHIFIKNLKFLVGSYNEVKNEVLRQIASKRSLTVLPCSLNDVARTSLYPKVKIYYRRIDICTTDGMPLVWWAMLQTKSKIERVYGPNLTKSVLIDTQGVRFRHVFCGSSVTRLKKLVDRVLAFAPNVNIVGLFSPKTQLKATKEEKGCLKKIIKCAPSILWFGISSPKQVVLAIRWKRYLPHTTIFCVGAALDLISGALPSAPTWIQAAGLEWLFRLMIEPRRLYKRYLFVIPRFLFNEIKSRLRSYFF